MALLWTNCSNAALGGGGGGAAGGVAGALAQKAANAPLVASNAANTAATVANTAAATAETAAGTALTAGEVALTAAITALNAAVDLNTAALWATGFIPGAQEGGQVMRSGVAIIHAGETVASKNIMQGVGEGLSASATGGGTQVVNSFDGATFHGVPDQRYVSGIMDNAVRQLRQSSRTWAFNPTGK